MGTTVNFNALMLAIGRELGKQIDTRTTEGDALAQLSADATTHAQASIAYIAAQTMPDAVKNEMCNRLDAYRLATVTANNAQIAVLNADIEELQRQINDAANIAPETFGADESGNVDFDVAVGAVMAGLDANQISIVAEAEANLAAAHQRANTIEALKALTALYRPEMIDQPDFLDALRVK